MTLFKLCLFSEFWPRLTWKDVESIFFSRLTNAVNDFFESHAYIWITRRPGVNLIFQFTDWYRYRNDGFRFFDRICDDGPSCGPIGVNFDRNFFIRRFRRIDAERVRFTKSKCFLKTCAYNFRLSYYVRISGAWGAWGCSLDFFLFFIIEKSVESLARWTRLAEKIWSRNTKKSPKMVSEASDWRPSFVHQALKTLYSITDIILCSIS